MTYSIMHHDFKSKYYNLVGDGKKDAFKYITGAYVAWFYGVMMTRIWSNNTSITNMWLVCEYPINIYIMGMS